LGSYHISAAEISDEREVVGIVNIAVAHKQQVFFTYNLLNASRHLVAKQAFLLSFVHKLCQLLEAVLPLSHAVTHAKNEQSFNVTETETAYNNNDALMLCRQPSDGSPVQRDISGARNTCLNAMSE